MSPLASERDTTVTAARLSDSASVNWKSETANALAVSSAVVTLLAWATGGVFAVEKLQVVLELIPAKSTSVRSLNAPASTVT